MRAIALLVRGISAVNTAMGWFFAFFALGIVLVCFTVVVLRYAFQTGAVWLQDTYIWMNGAMFMGIAGYALLKNQHVRVDIFYREASLRRRAIVDIVGALIFVGPFIYVIVYWGWPYVMRSWRILESSPNAGGLPGLFLLKTMILVFAGVIGIQALAMIGRGILVLKGREDLLPADLRYPSYED